ncbi:MAG: ABC transporter substrate-binding protein [Mariniphaga sp.]|nr:ABC transporter substrate-binding protein [Mariniphaga sp.]
MKSLNIIYQTCLLLLFTTLNIPKVDAIPNLDQTVRTVKIGLLITDNKAVAAKNGAEMAIRIANEKGGCNGHPFELIVRSMEGPWGTGAKEAVNMVFKHEVWAIIGSADGRNAHLIEQVTAKSHTVFLSAWSGDPTLSQAFVPWYFSCVPNFNQQALVLVDEIYQKQNFSRVGLVYDNEYESQSALKCFLKRTKLAGKADPVQFSFNESDTDPNNLLDKIEMADIQCLTLFLKPASALKVIQQIRQKKKDIPVFSTLSLLNENEVPINELRSISNGIRITSSQWQKSQSNSFNDEFQKRFAFLPGTVAAYAFDGMNLLIEAVRKAGSDRGKVQKIMSEIHQEGVTGPIQFDDKGNRTGAVVLMEIKNGIVVIPER